MSSLSPMTELDAVNTMLDTIGEAPVSTLVDLNVVDANNAIRILHRVNRNVQEEGWEFNTEVNFKLLQDEAGNIHVPNNVLSIDTDTLSSSYRVTQRGTKLYNLKDHTYKFDEALYVRMVLFLPFEDLPQAARSYITIRAARIFGDKMLGTQEVHEYSIQDEYKALAQLKRAEMEAGDHNIFYDSMSTFNINNR